MHSFTPKSRGMRAAEATTSPDDNIVPGSAKFDNMIQDMSPAELREFADYIEGKLDESPASDAIPADEDMAPSAADAAMGDADAEMEPDADTDPLEGLETEESDEDDAI